MKAYKYDNDGFYIGSVNVQKEPNGNDYLMPKNTTLNKPNIIAGKKSKWTGSRWYQITVDYNAIDLEILAQVKAKADNLSICTKLELSEAMDILELSEMFNGFKALPKFDLTNDFKFNHPVIIQAMAEIDTEIIQSIKEQIIKNRAV